MPTSQMPTLSLPRPSGRPAEAQGCLQGFIPSHSGRSPTSVENKTPTAGWLVVGEAKRGKSTFVNALIGRDILPTDVRVATSQVFDVRPADREAYHLRFE